MPDKVTITLDRDGCYGNGGHTVIINRVDEKGNGDGYRLVGPKLCSLGRNQHLTTYELSERDAREVFGYIQPLLGDEWLAERVAEDDEQ